jgi:NAD-dependent DNA ligase
VTHAEAKNRHAHLSDEIRRHDRAYYVEGRQLITDREYDQLFAELQKLKRISRPRLARIAHAARRRRAQRKIRPRQTSRADALA